MLAFGLLWNCARSPQPLRPPRRTERANHRGPRQIQPRTDGSGEGDSRAVVERWSKPPPADAPWTPPAENRTTTSTALVKLQAPRQPAPQGIRERLSTKWRCRPRSGLLGSPTPDLRATHAKLHSCDAMASRRRAPPPPSVLDFRLAAPASARQGEGWLGGWRRWNLAAARVAVLSDDAGA
jgi:hypothetical protein